ncbi:hypothetical protein GGX14DRAFT_571578 [Mycena pura]|uniref:Uncharacterized protein n=1 Tax=Mycena pura TaxID=153505 RepID=A0AAD6Y5W9_9AGAR|nr:hypothetical protein GGX14DRAFT_571578 [Mycena pura]
MYTPRCRSAVILLAPYTQAGHLIQKISTLDPAQVQLRKEEEEIPGDSGGAALAALAAPRLLVRARAARVRTQLTHMRRPVPTHSTHTRHRMPALAVHSLHRARTRRCTVEDAADPTLALACTCRIPALSSHPLPLPSVSRTSLAMKRPCKDKSPLVEPEQRRTLPSSLRCVSTPRRPCATTAHLLLARLQLPGEVRLRRAPLPPDARTTGNRRIRRLLYSVTWRTLLRAHLKKDLERGIKHGDLLQDPQAVPNGCLGESELKSVEAYEPRALGNLKHPKCIALADAPRRQCHSVRIHAPSSDLLAIFASTLGSTCCASIVDLAPSSHYWCTVLVAASGCPDPRVDGGRSQTKGNIDHASTKGGRL